MHHPLLPLLTPPRVLLLLCLLSGQALRAQEPALARVETQQETELPQDATALKEALSLLEAQYHVKLVYRYALIAGKQSPAAHGAPDAETALGALLAPHGLSFKKLKPGFFAIVPPPVYPLPLNRAQGPAATASAAFKPLPAAALALARVAAVVSGRVVGPDNEGVPGVNVIERGTTNGTITDISGRYSLQVQDGATLVFSAVGFLQQEVETGGRPVVDVTLREDVKSLEEVVVVGYGTQQRRDVTSSISSVSGADLQNQPVSQADALLQGKAAGVQVVQNTGAPGAEVFVRVRGSNSLLGDSRPLYVVDGVPINNVQNTFLDAGGERISSLASLNPNDIERIEVLKDAAAAAIYGSRGSNGVILITTKRGKSGQGRISFDAFTGMQQVWKRMDLLNGADYRDVLFESRTNRGLSNDVFPYNQVQVTGLNTDWQDAIFRTAPISSYNLSASGGEGRLSTFFSGGYFHQAGTIIGQDYKRITGRLNLDYQATDRLKVGANVNYTNSWASRIANGFSGNSVLAAALFQDPNLPVYQDGGYSFNPLGINNPVALANEIDFKNNQDRIIGNVYAEYQLLEGLTLRTTVGIDNLYTRDRRFQPSTIFDGNYNFQTRQGLASAQASQFNELLWLNENTINYRRTFGSHDFQGLLGTTFQQSRRTFLEAGGRNAATDNIPTVAISDPSVPGHFINTWALASYFGRVNYDYQGRYLLSAVLRADGSSRFGANNRFGIFPGLSGGWRVSGEPFMQNLTMVNELKLRASYGVTGNQEGFDEYASLTRYFTGNNYTSSAPGAFQGTVGNLDLSWESTATTNLGLDLGLFNNRVNVTVDAYVKRTRDLLFTRDLPWTSGFWNATANLGDMENRGLELALSTRNVTGVFTWSTDFNISFNRNKITSLPTVEGVGSDYIFDMPDAFGLEGPYSIYRVGQPVGSFYGYLYQGVYATDADVPRIPEPGTENKIRDLFERGVQGGDANFLDVDTSGSISRDADRLIIGNALPQHTGGITNTFGYKGFELSVLFNWSYGNDIYNYTSGVLESMNNDFNQSVAVLDRWQQPGDVTNVPRAYYGSNSVAGAAPTDASTRYLEDGSFLRMRNVTLGYRFPAELVQRLRLSNARVYVSGQNLLTITNYSGFDPENQNMGGGVVPTLGVDYLTQPQARVYTIGINLGF